MGRKINAFAIIRPFLTFSVVLPLVASSAAIVILSFAVPLTVLQAYDRIIAFRSLPTLTWLCLGCLAALGLNALMEYGRGLLGAWTAARFIRRTDRALIGRILDADPDATARGGAERHLERFRALGSIANVVIAQTLPVIAEAPFFLAYLAIMIFIGGWAAVPSIAAGIAELLLALGLRGVMFKSSTDAEAAERERVDYLAYALDRIHFIKAQALEHVVLRGFQQAQSDEAAASDSKMAINRRLDEFGRFLMSLTTFGTILWGGILVARGGLTVGAVSACLFFAGRMVGIARDVRRTAFALTEARADLAELQIGLELPPRADAGEDRLPRGAEGRLEFDAVRYADPDTEELLIDGLTFTVRPGVFVQVGPVSGGSAVRGRAICRLAAGLASPTAGQVLIDAYQSHRWNFLGPGATVAYISSRSGVLPGTILDNIASFDPGRRENALDVAQLFGLDLVVSRLPRGFETEIGPKDSGGLSASALRLVTVARGLALRPRLLVWDLADIDLDDDARLSVLAVLKELRGATTALIHSGDPSFRALAETAVGERAASA